MILNNNINKIIKYLLSIEIYCDHDVIYYPSLFFRTLAFIHIPSLSAVSHDSSGLARCQGQEGCSSRRMLPATSSKSDDQSGTPSLRAVSSRSRYEAKGNSVTRVYYILRPQPRDRKWISILQSSRLSSRDLNRI